ncbi:MAG: ATP-dependent DNA ligase [Rhodospirillales bacterium]|nr:ATP-dependent DNA ligase [Rhodospirillales bacterium]
MSPRQPADPLPADFEPMEARAVERLPEGEGWQFEPKWDGFRCLALRDGERVELRARSGKPLARYFPEMVAALHALPLTRFVLDGELAVPDGDSLSFDALQARLHPAASRIRRLSVETPSRLVLFDCLSVEGAWVADAPLEARRDRLELLFARFGDAPLLRLTPMTRDRAEAESWLAHLGAALDGVVAKRLDAPYQPGERAMLKVKNLRTADCVVGGFRYGTKSRVVGSLLLGLYDAEGRLDHVGFTSAIPAAERSALTRRLEALVEPPGFTGDAPGGPSRWSNARSAEWQPLRPELVAEVRYDHATGGRFRHGTTFLRWRPDKPPARCTKDQVQAEARPAGMMGAR